MPTATVVLIGHPANPPQFGQRVEATLTTQPDGGLMLSYAIRGGLDDLVLPTADDPAPADALWSTTCCELFVASGAGYREFNFSPSGQWAAYDFRAYRERAPQPPALPAPRIALERAAGMLRLDVALAAAALPAAGTLRLGVSAVLRTRAGATGHWALAHAPGQPDFHHPSAFALTLREDAA